MSLRALSGVAPMPRARPGLPLVLQFSHDSAQPPPAVLPAHGCILPVSVTCFQTLQKTGSPVSERAAQ